jgi:hypothetical protein
MTEVHSYPAAIAHRLAAALAEVADGGLTAVYLHGSAVLGGWLPGQSDVDVLIVAADHTDDAAADSMARAMVATAEPRRLIDQPPGAPLEASIVTVAAAREPRPPWPFLRHVATNPDGTVRVVGPNAGGDRDLLMHYVVGRAAGYAAFGPPPRDLVGPIPRAAILDYLADELIWALGNASAAYAVLNACRARLYLSDGVIVSKLAGGETAVQRHLGPDAVIRPAERRLLARPRPRPGRAIAGDRGRTRT